MRANGAQHMLIMVQGHWLYITLPRVTLTGTASEQGWIPAVDRAPVKRYIT